MGDENPICTLGDYSRPSHESYRNTIELPEGNNVGKNAPATAKLRNDILMFQQHHGESLSKAWTRFKDLLRKVPHHGIDLWLQVQIFYDRIGYTLKRTVDYTARGRLRKLSAEKAWATIERVAQYEDEGWNDAFTSKKVSFNYENPNVEQLLKIMECKVDTLIKDAISLMGKSKSVFRSTTNEMCQPPTELSR
ncbi:zinc finger, CCHC-type containing protein [Tanacetum coccineum]|uniref:Zinc finger, CCHC-type containing protein n=1 Tax=Tanacetum coccineum TaxID=301880 RepID=A0ABQ4WZR0_9ASTR